MKSKTLKLTPEAANKAFETADENGKKLLISLYPEHKFLVNIMDRLQTVEDIFKYHGITEAQFDKDYENRLPHEKARRFEELMVEAYNEKVKPDWRDGKPKYAPWFNMPDASGSGFSFYSLAIWYSSSFVGSRQIFVGPNAKAHMLDAVKKFLPQYEKSRTQ